MAADIKLISTDFDGTLVPAFGGPAPFSDELIELLTELRRRGVRWAVNTGRSPGLLKDAWEHCGLNFHPDFALTSERDVYRPCDQRVGEWVDYGDWNQQTLAAHREGDDVWPAIPETTEKSLKRLNYVAGEISEALTRQQTESRGEVRRG